MPLPAKRAVIAVIAQQEKSYGNVKLSGACAIALILLGSVVGIFGQGAINFNNRATTVGTGAQAPVVAPIFGVDPQCYYGSKNGNPAADWNGTNGPTPVPIGTQVYGGAPLVGTGFTVTL